MTVLRKLTATTALAAAVFAAVPASAQFYFKSHDFSGPPIRGDEPGLPTLPGANDEEVRANLVWNLRSALNVAALQCQFEPSLMTVENYNIMLINHQDEFKKSLLLLTKYFARTNKSPRLGQDAMDRYGTKTYSAFTTTGAQFGFCQTAGAVATHAAYAPRGQLYQVAANDMSALRNALVPWGEERFPRRVVIDTRVSMARLDDMCWSKRGEWVERKCGAFTTVFR
ncbi:hypothetical protein U1872_17205 [Sphingomonas sp. RB3P16]|uniref:hypothetical protein n=1 Tax=Parasphingomonas frigoris TaxID=3096163 RepID=UPI002FC58CD2